MDKYEFNIKVEQIKKMVARGDYETAMKISDTIDWRRVRNVNILTMVATIYEKNEEYQEAKDILLLAFERAPIGKRLVYKLTELAVKEGSVQEAEDYYKEFCDLAPDDPRQYILRYLILGAKGAPVEQLIHTLEQYCNIELDEKWLYELAELYAKAGMGELCIMACDKLMLMFGLGKYVDKAMELKQEFAPLSGYQRDLVENRDKYEARLKAVEEDFDQGSRRTVYEPEDHCGAEDRWNVKSRYDREAQEDSYESGEPQEPYDAYQEAALSMEPEAEEYQGEGEDEEPRRPVTIEPEMEPEEGGMEEPAAQAEPQSVSASEYRKPETVRRPADSPVTLMSDEAVKSRLHEAQAQADLAREMSRMSINQHKPEREQAQTRVLTDIKDLGRSSVLSESHHFMIEAEYSRSGLDQAVQLLKKIHKESGEKNQAARISGEKLNTRGVFAIADKLTGKDLIIEQAGAMDDKTLQELNQLMARDETGMNVVLIDGAGNLARIHNVYPGLAKRFEYVGKAEKTEKTENQPPVRQVQVVRPKEESPAVSRPARQAGREAVKPQRLEHPEASGSARPGSRPAQSVEEKEALIQIEERKQPETVHKAQPEAGHKAQQETVHKARPEVDFAPSRNSQVKEKPEPQVELEEPDDSGQEEMDMDEFAQYACKYASDIDCSISGKSMLALYERIEIMEEDGVPLTRTNAEDLIEEAADKAENPSFIKKITGIFSSKYDKNGLLILREEHFV